MRPDLPSLFHLQWAGLACVLLAYCDSAAHKLGKATMKILSLALFGLIAAHSSVVAQSCFTDSYGNTTCQNSDGTTTRAFTDPYGNTTIRRSDGATTRATTDPYGNTTYRNSDGTTKRCSTNAYGNTRCH